jgi:malonyl CoA-acyl carrier protein transacylase
LRVGKFSDALEAAGKVNERDFSRVQSSVNKHSQQLEQIQSAAQFQQLAAEEALERIGGSLEKAEARVAATRAAGLIKN